HAYVLGLALLDGGEDRDVGTVQRDRRRDVGQLEVATDHRDVDDAERGDDPAIRHLDQLVARREALRRVDRRQHEDLAGLRVLRAEYLLVLERAQVARAVVPGDVVVRQPDVSVDVLHRLLGRFVHTSPSVDEPETGDVADRATALLVGPPRRLDARA